MQFNPSRIFVLWQQSAGLWHSSICGKQQHIHSDNFQSEFEHQVMSAVRGGFAKIFGVEYSLNGIYCHRKKKNVTPLLSLRYVAFIVKRGRSPPVVSIP